MATFLFRIFPAISHHNATFQVAAGLKARGHRVVYAATGELGAVIEAQGLEWLPLEEDFFPAPHPRDSVVEEAEREGLWWWRDWRERCRQVERMRQLFSRGRFFDDLIEQVKPDAILVDSPYVLFALSLLRRPVRVGIIESMVNLAYAPNCPPLCSTRVPRSGWPSRFGGWWDWQRQRAATRVRTWVHLDMKRPRGVVERALAGVAPVEETVDFRRYFHIGIKRYPEFILSPREFDFPRPVHPWQHYIGPSVNLERGEASFDFRFNRLFDRLVRQRAQGRKLVYCAFGTMSFRYRGMLTFLRRLLEAAGGADWQLMLSLGEEIDVRLLGAVPRNVTIFQRVPQLRVLREVDLMLSHGGMNSVAEALLLEVPLVVVPGDHKIDQAGNAARVVYHGCGRQLRMTRAQPAAIRAAIETVLGDPDYQRRTATLSARIRASEAYRDGAAILERVMLGQEIKTGGSV